MPVDSTGIELQVFSGSSPTTMIDVLPNRIAPQVMDEMKGPGGGSFSLFSLDPKLKANPAVLDYENIVKFVENGKVKGAFVIQTKSETIIEKGEMSSKGVRSSGEGLKTWFRGAELYPEGGLKAQSAEQRVFSWASKQGSWYKPEQWTGPVIVAPYEMLPPKGSTNPWKYQPAEWPDFPNAKWIWSEKNDTKPYSVPAGVTYFRYEFDTTTAGTYSVFAAADNTFQAFMDAEVVIDASDTTQAFIQTYRADVDLLPGHHVLAFQVYNKSGVAGLLSALSRVGVAEENIPAQLITYTGLFNNWKVNGYPTVEPGWSVGEIILTLLNEAKARGIRFASLLKPTFTETTDSNGKAWDRPLPWTFDIGSNYYDIIAKLEELACDVWIDPDTYDLNVYATRGADRAVQTTSGEPVQLREGKNLTKATEDGQADIKNVLLMKTNDGWIEAKPATSASETKYGRREGSLSTQSNAVVSRELAQQVFTQKQAAETGATYSLIPVERAVPLEDFFVGDWVQAPNSLTSLTRRRVMSVSMAEDGQTGYPTYTIEFDTIFQSKEAQLDRWLSLAAGGGLGAGFAGSGLQFGGAGSPSTSPIGSPTRSNPVAPVARSVTSQGLWGTDRTPYSEVTVTWDPVTTTTDGNAATMAYYEVYGKLNNGAIRYFATVEGTSTGATFSPIKSGATWTFYVKAFITPGRVSEYSNGLPHFTLMPAYKMVRPSPPILTSRLGNITANWDGKDANGDQMASQFDYMYAIMSPAQNGTYSQAGSTVSSASSIIITRLTVGTQYWVKLIAVDRLGVETDPSNAVAITVDGIDTAALDKEITDAIEAAKVAADNAVRDSAAAVDSANTANSTANNAQTAAGNAATAAANAAGIANGKGKVITRSAAPDAADRNENTLWIDTTGGANTPKRWNSTTSTWVAVTDKAATDAAAAAAAAQSKADQAARDADAASTKAGLAQTSADSKNRVFYLNSKPVNSTTNPLKVGDTWFDSANGQRMSKWDGTDWILVPFGGQAIADAAISSVKLGQSVNDAIQKGIDDAKIANDNALVAMAAANGLNTIFFSTSNPSNSQTPGKRAGDIWYRRQAGTGNIIAMWEWSGSTWDSRVLENAMIANLDAGKITVGFLDADRIAANSLTASKITVADFTNLVDDPNFTTALGKSWLNNDAPSLANSQISNTTGGPGLALQMNAAASSGNIRFNNGNRPTAKEGDQFAFGVRAQNNTNAATNVFLSFRDSSGAQISAATLTISPNGTTWGNYEASAVAPAGTATVIYILQTNAASTTNSAYFAKPFLRRKNEGSLIIDGAVTADKMAANSVQARHIIVGDFTNLASGSDFEDINAVPWDMSNGRLNISTTVGHSPSSSLRVSGGSGVITSELATRVDVNADEVWYFELWALRDANYNGQSDNAKLRIGSQTGALLASVGYGAENFPSGGWVKLTGEMKVTNAVTKLRVSLNFNHTAGLIYLDDIILRRKTGGTMIVDGSVTATQMATGTITADSGIIANAAINSAQIANLDAGKITTGFLSGTRIAANTITSRQLIIGDFTNLAEDGSFEIEAVRNQWPRTGAWEYREGSTGSHWGNWYLVLNAGAANFATTSLGSDFQVQPGEKYYMEWWQRRASANQPAGLNFQVLDKLGTSTIAFDLKPVTPSATATNNTWIMYSGVVTIPDGAGWVRPQFKYNASAAMTGAWAFDDVTIHKQSGTTLIENDSIQTQHIVTDGIVAKHIKSREISAIHIGTGTITANEIKGGVINGDLLTGDAIDGKTITGATIRSAASGPRIQIIGTTLQGYAASGNPFVQLDTAGGGLLRMNNQNTGSTNVNGITWYGGGAVFTHPSFGSSEPLSASGIGWTQPQGSTVPVLVYGSPRYTNGALNNSGFWGMGLTSSGGVILTSVSSGAAPQVQLNGNRVQITGTGTTSAAIPGLYVGSLTDDRAILLSAGNNGSTVGGNIGVSGEVDLTSGYLSSLGSDYQSRIILGANLIIRGPRTSTNVGRGEIQIDPADAILLTAPTAGTTNRTQLAVRTAEVRLTNGNLVVVGNARITEAYNLAISGGRNVVVRSDGGIGYTSSKRANKKNFADFVMDEKRIETAMGVKIRTYMMKKFIDPRERPQRELGAFAEDLHEAGFTELVQYEADEHGEATDVPAALSYDRFGPFTWAWNQSQETRIQEQASEIDTLKDLVASLVKRLDAVESK